MDIKAKMTVERKGGGRKKIETLGAGKKRPFGGKGEFMMSLRIINRTGQKTCGGNVPHTVCKGQQRW